MKNFQLRQLPNPSRFQQEVYQICAQIPSGYLTTYQQIARILGSSPRAVGQALRKNPFAP